MSVQRLTDPDVVRALELADGRLEDAENVLWNASRRATSTEQAAAIEDLTRELWAVQHRLNDLQRELE